MTTLDSLRPIHAPQVCRQNGRSNRADSPSRRRKTAGTLRRATWGEPHGYSCEALEGRLLLADSTVFTGLPEWQSAWLPSLNNTNTTISAQNHPTSGAVNAVAPHPTDPNILFVATVNGGIWRTRNAQDISVVGYRPSWTPLTDRYAASSFGDIVFDRTDPGGNTLWASIARTSSGSGDGGPLGGLLRTADQGNTWVPMAQGTLGNQNVIKVVPTALTNPATSAQIVLAASSGALWRSADGGNRFGQLTGATNTDFIDNDLDGVFDEADENSGLPVNVVSDVVADPLDPNVFYAALPNAGIFRSRDGGVTWAAINNGANGVGGVLAASRIRLASTAAALYAAVISSASGQLSGVFRLGNPHLAASTTWTSMGVPETPAAATGTITTATNASPIVVTSNNHGRATGTRVRVAGVTGNTAANGDWQITVLDVNRFSLDGVAGNGAYTGGGTWTVLQGIHPRVKPGGQGNLHLSLVADPNNPNVVYIGGDRSNNRSAGNLWRGTFGGGPNTWTPIVDANANGTAPHADSRDLEFAANGTLIEADDGGVNRLINIGASGQVWRSLVGTLEVHEVYSVRRTFDGPAFGTQDTGTPAPNKRDSSTFTTHYDDFSGGDGGVVAWDATSTPNTRYLFTSNQFLGGFNRNTFDQSTIFKGTSGITLVVTGAGGTALTKTQPNTNTNPPQFTFDNSIQFIQPYLLNAVNPQQMLIGTNFLYESMDQGSNLISLGGLNDLRSNGTDDDRDGTIDEGDEWTPAGALGGAAGGAISAMAYGGGTGVNANAAVIYAAVGANLFLRQSGAGLPTAIAAPAGVGAIRDIVLDPDDWKIAYIADSNGRVYRTNDATATPAVWTNLTGDLAPIAGSGAGGTNDLRTIEILKSGATRAIFVGGSGGVFFTTDTDASAHWREFGNFLPNVIVKDLQYDARTNLLVAGTWGRGVWQIGNVSGRFADGDPTTLTIKGDIESADERNVITLAADPNIAGLLRFTVTGAGKEYKYAVEASSLDKIVIEGGSGDDTYEIADVPAGVTLEINVGGASAVVTLAKPGAGIRNNISGPVSIRGEAGGTTRLTADDSGNPGNGFVVNASTLAEAGSIVNLAGQPVTYNASANVNTVHILTSAGGNNTVNLTATGVPTFVNFNRFAPAAAGSTINIGTAGSVQSIAGAVTIADRGVFDRINVLNNTDFGIPAIRLDQVPPPPGSEAYGRLSGLSPASISFRMSDLNSLVVSTGRSPEAIVVNGPGSALARRQVIVSTQPNVTITGMDLDGGVNTTAASSFQIRNSILGDTQITGGAAGWLEGNQISALIVSAAVNLTITGNPMIGSALIRDGASNVSLSSNTIATSVGVIHATSVTLNTNIMGAINVTGSAGITAADNTVAGSVTLGVADGSDPVTSSSFMRNRVLGVMTVHQGCLDITVTDRNIIQTFDAAPGTVNPGAPVAENALLTRIHVEGNSIGTLKFGGFPVTGIIRGNDIGSPATVPAGAPPFPIALDIAADFAGPIDENDIHNAVIGVRYAVPSRLIANRIFGNTTGVVMPVNNTAGGLGFFPGSGRNEIFNNTTGVNLTGRMQNQHIYSNTTGVIGSGILGGDSLDTANLIELNTIGADFSGIIQFNRIAANVTGILAHASQRVIHNLIYRNTLAGLRTSGVNEVRLYHNTFHVTGGNGVLVDGGSQHTELLNNIFQADAGVNIFVADNSRTGFFSDYNTLYSNGAGRLYHFILDFNDILDIRRGLERIELHSLGTSAVNAGYARPRFVNLEDDDYRVAPLDGGAHASSPTIDAGSPLIDSPLVLPPAYQNLLVNPSFENGLASWLGSIGAITQSGSPAPFDGGSFFTAGPVPGGWVQQSVSLTASGFTAQQIDARSLSIVFGGRTRSAAEALPDEGTLILTFLDASSSPIGVARTTRAGNTSDRWELLGDRIHVPVGARTALYRFESLRRTGASADSFLDSAFVYILPNSLAPDQGAYGSAPATDINLADPHLHLLSPQLYFDAELTAPQTITWATYNAGVATIRIDLYRDAADGPQFLLNLTPSTPDNGIFTWIPQNAGLSHGDTGLRVQVSLSNNATVFDRSSETFAIPANVQTYYVNDSSITGDQYTTAPGSNRNTGRTPADPKPLLITLFNLYSLKPGDTVYVDAGVYQHLTPLVISGNPTFGNDGGVAIVGPTSGGPVVISPFGFTSPAVIDINDGDFVSLSRLSIIGGEYGVLVRNGSTNFTASHLTVTGSILDGIRIEADSPNARLDHVIAAGNARDGISIGGPFNLIDASIAHNNTRNGFLLANAGAGIMRSSEAHANHNGLNIANSTTGVTSLVGDTDLSLGRGNRFHGNTEFGVTASGAVRIAGNVFHGQDLLPNAGFGGGVGINLVGQAQATLNVVRANHDGIRAAGNTITHNRVHNNTNIGIRGDGGSTIDGNTVYSNAVGIQSATVPNSGEGPFIRNNLVYANPSGGIRLLGGRNTQIHNNTVYEPAGDALRIEPAGASAGVNISVRNNILWTSGGYAIAVSSLSEAGLSSDYNLLHATGAGQLGLWAGVARTTLREWRLAGFTDLNSIAKAPHFVDADGADNILGGAGGFDDDFHLQSTAGSFHGGSLAPILHHATGLPVFPAATLTPDAQLSPGVNRGDPAFAFAGEPVPNGAFIDLGAFGNTSQASLSPASYILMIRPNGGEIVLAEATFSIVWRSQNTVGAVNIALYSGDNVAATIASGAPNSGAYLWTIPGSIAPGSDYFIRVTRADDSSATDTNDAPLTILGPNHIFYVNDSTVESGGWTTAPGSNANTGLTPGDPMASIRAVIDTYSLSSADTIRIDSGHYTLSNNIVITVADAGVKIEGYHNPAFPGRSAVLNRDNTAPGSHVFQLVNAHNVTLDHLTITGAEIGIFAANGSDSDNLTVSNSVIQGNVTAGIYLWETNDNATLTGNTIHGQTGGGADGIVLRSIFATVTGNTLRNNPDSGIAIDGDGNGSVISGNLIHSNNNVGIVGSNLVVTGNTVHSNRSIGIQAGNSTVTGNVVHGIVSSAGGLGIGMLISGGTTTGNIIHSNSTGIFAGGAGTLANNRIYSNTAIGIDLGADMIVRENAVYSNGIGVLGVKAANTVGLGPFLYNNLIYANATIGISVVGGAHAQIFNNTVYQPLGDAFRMVPSAGSVNVQVRNNIFLAAAGYVMWIDPISQTGLISNHNLLLASGTARTGRWGGADRATLNDWRLASFNDADSIRSDPRFVNIMGPDGILGYGGPANDGRDDDFHLQSLHGSFHGGSPAPVLDAITGMPVYLTATLAIDPDQSPAIDRGAPGDPFASEPAPNGGFVNLGAYGNSAQASKSPAQYMLVTRPDGGEAWATGQTFSLRWRNETVGTGTVRIELLHGNLALETLIAADAPNTGLFSWVIPAAIPAAADYLIRITRNTTAIADVSDDPFSISVASPIFYVNDPTVEPGDWTTAPGDDNNDGLTPATPKASIGALLAAYDFEPGDVIRVDAGNHAVANNILLQDDDSGVRIQGYHGSLHPDRKAVLNRNNIVGGHIFQLAGGDDITIDDLVMTGALYGVTTTAGQASNNITLINNEFHGMSSLFAGYAVYIIGNANGLSLIDNIIRNNDQGVHIQSISNLTIQGNAFHNNRSRALTASSINGGRIDGNHFSGNTIGVGANTIDVSSSSAASASAVIVSNNLIHDNGFSGLSIASNVLAVGNTVHSHPGSNSIGITVSGGEARGNIIYGNATGIFIPGIGLAAGNRVFGNSAVGIYVTYSGVLRGNTVYSNPTGILGDAARNAASRGPYLYNNVVYANASNGIHIRGGSDAEIFNNTVFQPNGDGIRLDGGGLGSVNVQVRNNIVVVNAGPALRVSDNSAPQFSSDYNNLYATGAGTFGNWAGREFATREAWTWTLQLDTHGQSIDPLFVSPAGADGILGFVGGEDFGADDNFALAPGSPSIDAGDPAFHVLSEPSPNGGRINLGHHGNTFNATPSPAQLVQVLSPNGLEKVESGQQYPITWHTSGLRTSHPVAFINAAGPAAGGWSANAFSGSFSTTTVASAINRTGVTDPAPEAVYQTAATAVSGTNYSLTYTFPVPDGVYDLRLHFIEPNQFTPVGARRMDIGVNGAVLAANYDIRAAAGAHHKAIALAFTATASGGTGLNIHLATVGSTIYPAILSGIELTQPNPAGLASHSASLELSTDNGVNWLPIAVEQPTDFLGNGSFLWTAGPESTGNTALIRITANTPGTPRDVSDSPFRIVGGGTDYYINDDSTAGDLLTTATGNDANSGKSPDQPMASLEALILAHDLNPGDVIHVDTGTYSLIRNIRMTAEDSGVRIQGPGGPAVALLNRNNTSWDGAVIFELAGASDVVIDSLSLTNAYNAVWAPWSTNSDRVSISSNDIYANLSGIVIGGTNDDWVISGNQIHHHTLGGNFSSGIVTQSVRSTISGNRIHSNFNRGILLESGGRGTLITGNEIYLNRIGIQADHVTATGNLVYLNSASGMSISGSAQSPTLIDSNIVHSHIAAGAIGIDAITSEIRSNIVYNNAIGINANGGFVNRNRVYSNATAGIAALGTAPSIWHNLIYANGNIGIRLTNATGASIIGNTVHHTVGEAIRFQGSANATLRNNIVWVEAGHCLYFADAASQSSVKSGSNLLHRGNAPQAHIGFWSGASRTLLADWQAASALDADSLSADPLFIDIDGGDNILGYNAVSQYDGGFDDNFKLFKNSPALDRGDSFAGLIADIEFQLRHDDPATTNAGTLTYAPQEQASSLFAATGVALNLRSNNTYFYNYALPFAFPFYDDAYTKVIVSTEGFLEFLDFNYASDNNNSAASLIARRRIAPLWDNMRTNGAGNDVFIDTSVASEISFRWNATNEADDSPLSFSTILFSDGRIRFDYGAGNTNLTPTVGISMGNGQQYVILPYSGASSLTNASSILFARVPGFADIGAYEMIGSSADNTGPTITSSTPAAIHAGGSIGILSQITLSLSEAVIAVDANSPLSYELRAAGFNGAFDDADDSLYLIQSSHTAGETSILLDILDGPLPLGNYRLTVFGGPGRGIHDEPGNFLDGDANGVPGGSYIRTFTVDSGLVLNALPGNNTFTLRLNPAGTAIQVWHNVSTAGPVTSTIPLGTANPIVVIGGDGDDTLILDLSSGNFIPVGGVSFSGKAQATGDSLRIVGNGANTVLNTPSATVSGVGTVLVDGSPIHFTGLEPVTVSAVASVTLITPSAGDSITIDSPEASVNRIFGTSGGIAFEPLVITSVPTLILDTAANDGGGGNDSITIGPAGLIATGLNLLRINAGTGLNTLTVNGGPAPIDTNLGLGGVNLSLTTAGNASITLRGAQQFAAVSLAGASSISLPLNGGNTLVTSGLAMASGAKLDLADNDLIIHATAATRASVLDAVTGYVASARNSTLGRWLGDGLTSSAAAANQLAGLAAILNDENGVMLRPDLNGQPATLNSILVRYTHNGDLDASGALDGDDYFRMDRGFLQQGGLFARGDINYDGRTDGADYFLLDQAFLHPSVSPSPFAIPVISPTTASPAPVSPWRAGEPIAMPASFDSSCDDDLLIDSRPLL